MSYRSTGFGQLAITLLVTILSVPAVVLLIAFTQGGIAVPLVVVLCVTPWFLFHYVIWGRNLSHRWRRENADAHESDETP